MVSMVTTKNVTHTLLLAIVSAAASLTALLDAGAQHISTNVNVASQQAWISETITRLRSAQPETPAWQTWEAEIFDLKHFERNQLMCQVASDYYIKIGTNNWVYFMLHSAHKNAAIGDVVLAIDQDGDIYRCVTHVCGGSTDLMNDDLDKPVSSKDFFTRFYANYDTESRWIKIDAD